MTKRDATPIGHGSDGKEVSEGGPANAVPPVWGLMTGACDAAPVAIFAIVKMINRLKRAPAAPTVPPEPPRQEVLLMEIRDALRLRADAKL